VSDKSFEAKETPWIPSFPVLAPYKIRKLPGFEAMLLTTFSFSIRPTHITLTKQLLS
jgi:hypothetical protein